MATKLFITFYSKENKLISLEELDKEVCEFWGVSINVECYAIPSEINPAINEKSWYDRLRFYLWHSLNPPDSGKREMDELIDLILNFCKVAFISFDKNSGEYHYSLGYNDTISSGLFKTFLKMEQPYIDLFLYLKWKGYYLNIDWSL
jgi:hypothetical protein